MNLFTKFNRRAFIYLLLLAGIVAYLFTVQENSIFSRKAFTIKISKTPETVQLTCQDGCDWKTLSFPNQSHEKRFIDQSGMYLNNKETSDDADFEFSIEPINQAIKMEGIKGVAWKQLQFRLYSNNSKRIDQNGFTERP